MSLRRIAIAIAILTVIGYGVALGFFMSQLLGDVSFSDLLLHRPLRENVFIISLRIAFPLVAGAGATVLFPVYSVIALNNARHLVAWRFTKRGQKENMPIDEHGLTARTRFYSALRGVLFAAGLGLVAGAYLLT